MNFKGIHICDERINDYKKTPIKGAYCNGIYIGSPGMDIYYMLPYLTDEQMNEIADLVVFEFPMKPPGNHVNVAAFIRFLYGNKSKQGVLRSGFENKEYADVDWRLSREFIKILFDKLEKNANYYGMSILCEMNAHRLGDEAVLDSNTGKLVEMEKLYCDAVKFAYECKSYKQMFTPYYWCFKYFKRCKNVNKALRYAYKTVSNAEKFCPDSRASYVEKVSECMRYIKRRDKNMWKKLNKKCKPVKNKCVKKSFRSVK